MSRNIGVNGIFTKFEKNCWVVNRDEPLLYAPAVELLNLDSVSLLGEVRPGEFLFEVFFPGVDYLMFSTNGLFVSVIYRIDGSASSIFVAYEF